VRSEEVNLYLLIDSFQICPISAGIEYFLSDNSKFKMLLTIGMAKCDLLWV